MKKALLSGKNRGFTIVELLVVIVVIGVLAAITTVSYTGVTNRANTASAQAAADAVYQKWEVYNADTGAYPATWGVLDDDATKIYYMPTTSISGTLINAPTTPGTVNVYKCGTSGTATVPANIGAITVVSGYEFLYWNYNPTAAVNVKTVGTAGTNADYEGAITSPATLNYNTFPVACFIMAS